MAARMDFYRYLPVSERDKQWGVYVCGAGASSVPAFSASYPVRVHPNAYQFAWGKGRVLHEFQVLYVTRGEGEFESASANAKAIEAGTAILLFPGEWHRYRPRSETGWDEYWVSFNGVVPQQLVRYGFLVPTQPVLAIGRDERLLQQYQAILDEIRGEPVGYQQVIASKVLVILATIQAIVRSQRSTGRHEAVVSQAKLLLQQPESLVSIDWLAEQVRLSPAQLRRVFKEHTGVSPYQYYNQMRMNRAKELLRDTTLSVKQVADQLCYESPYHFSKAFKTVTGRSPTEWREGR